MKRTNLCMRTLFLIAILASQTLSASLRNQQQAESSQFGEFPFPSYFHFDNCDGFNYDDYVKDYSFAFKPSPPKAGVTSYLSAQATVKKSMFVHSGRFKIAYNGIPLMEYTMPWNQFYAAGDTYKDTIYCPFKYGVRGRYTYTVRVFDNTAKQLFCVEGWFLLA